MRLVAINNLIGRREAERSPRTERATAALSRPMHKLDIYRGRAELDPTSTCQFYRGKPTINYNGLPFYRLIDFVMKFHQKSLIKVSIYDL